MQIHLLGTSHVSSTSIRLIRKAVKEVQPTVIAVELDPYRLQGMQSGAKKRLSFSMMRTYGLKGFMFAAFAMTMQSIVGRVLKIEPGSDMMEGVKLAQNHNIKLKLIDIPIHITLQRVSKGLTFREIGKYIYDIIYGSLRPKKFARKYNLQSFSVQDPDPDAIQPILSYMRQRFPGLYRPLVHDRNVFMVQQLRALGPEEIVLAIVGAGHVPGMKELLDQPQMSFTVSGTDVDVV